MLLTAVAEFTLANHASLNVPAWQLLPAILFSMACVLWISNALAEARARHRAERPDYARYHGRSAFTTWEAAALWAGQPINTPRLSEAGYEIFTALKRAIDDGTIKATVRSAEGTANRATLIPVEELRVFATRRGEQPKFLYPDRT